MIFFAMLLELDIFGQWTKQELRVCVYGVWRLLVGLRSLALVVSNFIYLLHEIEVLDDV